MGNTFNVKNAPVKGEGVTVHTFSFTPRSGSSKLLIETPPIPVGETKNVADDFRIAGKAHTCAWYDDSLPRTTADQENYHTSVHRSFPRVKWSPSGLEWGKLLPPTSGLLLLCGRERFGGVAIFYTPIIGNWCRGELGVGG